MHIRNRMIKLTCRGVAISCFVLLICTLIGTTQSAPSDPQEYQNMAEIYDWLSEHELERREVPSMRLRFGKRDMRGMWTVAQRSMPSLRLRFGKRDGGAGEQVAWDEPEVERRAGGGRSPALRLRFGKREAPPDQQDLLLSSSENH